MLASATPDPAGANPRDVASSAALVERYRAEFASGPAPAAVADALRVANACLKIERAVIAGLGNLDPDTPRDRRRAARQLGLLLALLEGLGAVEGLPCVEGMAAQLGLEEGKKWSMTEMRAAALAHKNEWVGKRLQQAAPYLDKAGRVMLKGGATALADMRKKADETVREVQAIVTIAEAADVELRSTRETARLVAARAAAAGKGDALEKGAATIPAVAQDPAFTPTDAAVLARFGVRAVGAPEAVKDVGQDTLLFVPYVDVNVLMPHMLRNAKPGLYIGTNFRTVLETLNEPNYSAA